MKIFLKEYFDAHSKFLNFIIDLVALAKPGDNALGSIHTSVHLSVWMRVITSLSSLSVCLQSGGIYR